jgi:two-component system chemotaxis response regulator CheY
MPNMDGISFLKEKATREGIKDIPVLMISTETGDDIIGEAKALGALGAIKKPFTPDKVNEVLGPLL